MSAFEPCAAPNPVLPSRHGVAKGRLANDGLQLWTANPRFATVAAEVGVAYAAQP